MRTITVPGTILISVLAANSTTAQCQNFPGASGKMDFGGATYLGGNLADTVSDYGFAFEPCKKCCLFDICFNVSSGVWVNSIGDRWYLIKSNSTCRPQFIVLGSCGANLHSVTRFLPPHTGASCPPWPPRPPRVPNSNKTACMCVRARLSGTTIEGQIEFAAPDGWATYWTRGGDITETPIADGVSETGSTISGATTGQITISNATAADAGEYFFWVIDPDDATAYPVESCRMYFESDAAIAAHMPRSIEACTGGDTSFLVHAPDAVGYRWFWNGVPLSDGPLPADDPTATVVFGSDTDQLDLVGLDAFAEGQITCELVSLSGIRTEIFPTDLVVTSNAIAPTITSQPTGTSVTAGETAVFAVAADPGTPDGIVSYRWRKDGVELIDDGRILGSNWPTLDIADATGLDAGLYDCVITQACGTVTSFGATLIVTGCTFADCDASGVVNLDDIDCFVSGFLASDLNDADCDGNGTINLDDIDCFVASFLAGCP